MDTEGTEGRGLRGSMANSVEDPVDKYKLEGYDKDDAK